MKREKPIETLSEQELHALVHAAPSGTPSGARARATIAVLAYAGLRISEALALTPRDVDLEAGTISVLRGKGHKQRVAALLPEGVIHVERWLRRRESLGLSASTAYPLLCTVSSGRNVLCRHRGRMRPGDPLDRAFVDRLVRRLGRRAGIQRRIHPHGLRHSHAHLLALRGKLPTDIRDQLGHASLGMTSSYLDSFAPTGRVERLREEQRPRRQPAVHRLVEALSDLSGEDADLLVDLLSRRKTAPGSLTSPEGV